MNRRSFSQLVTGFVAGVVAAFAPKAKGLTVADLSKCRDKLKAKERPESALALSDTTLNWTNRGFYKNTNYVIEMHCCYTHKNGQKKCCVLLFDNVSINKDMKNADEMIRRRAIKGGVWYPTDETKYSYP